MAYTYFRLLNKVEDLERLMNDEVTDINEILNVINTIQVISNKTTGVSCVHSKIPLQVDKQIPELKHNKSHRFL